jgi:hypothetical protein
MRAVTHTHHWTTKSRHRTSQGTIGYQHCTCGRWRIHRDTTVHAPETVAVLRSVRLR